MRGTDLQAGRETKPGRGGGSAGQGRRGRGGLAAAAAAWCMDWAAGLRQECSPAEKWEDGRHSRQAGRAGVGSDPLTWACKGNSARPCAHAGAWPGHCTAVLRRRGATACGLRQPEILARNLRCVYVSRET